MPQGAYDVNKEGAEAPQDTSFRSCICAMLIFLIICLIILLATSTIPRSSVKEGPNSLQLNDSNKVKKKQQHYSHSIRVKVWNFFFFTLHALEKKCFLIASFFFFRNISKNG